MESLQVVLPKLCLACLTLPEKRDKGVISNILMRIMIFLSRNFGKRIFLTPIGLRKPKVLFGFKKYKSVFVRKSGFFVKIAFWSLDTPPF